MPNPIKIRKTIFGKHFNTSKKNKKKNALKGREIAKSKIKGIVKGMCLREKSLGIAEKLPKNITKMEKNNYITNELMGFVAEGLGFKGTKKRKFNSITSQSLRLGFIAGAMERNTVVKARLVKDLLNYALKTLPYSLKITRHNYKQGDKIKELEKMLLEQLNKMKKPVDVLKDKQLIKPNFFDKKTINFLKAINDIRLIELLESKENLEIFNLAKKEIIMTLILIK